MPIKNITLGFFAYIFIASISPATAQLKSYQLNPQGDTINAINKEDQKVGKWVIEVGELRGEPGYVEE
jgi:hypothetical protein